MPGPGTFDAKLLEELDRAKVYIGWYDWLAEKQMLHLLDRMNERNYTKEEINGGAYVYR